MTCFEHTVQLGNSVASFPNLRPNQGSANPEDSTLVLQRRGALGQKAQAAGREVGSVGSGEGCAGVLTSEPPGTG